MKQRKTEKLVLKDALYDMQLEASKCVVEQLNKEVKEMGIKPGYKKLEAKKSSMFEILNMTCDDLRKAKSLSIKGFKVEGAFSKAKSYVANMIRTYVGKKNDAFIEAKNNGFNFASTVLEYELIMEAMRTGTLYRQEQGVELKDSPLFRRYDVFCTDESCNNILDGDEVEFIDGESTDGRFFSGRIVNGMRPVFRDNFGGLFTIVHLMEVIEEPVDEHKFVVRVSGTKKSLENARNIFAAKDYGYKMFLLTNKEGKQGDGLYVVSEKPSMKGKLVKVVDCEIPGDRSYVDKFCGEVVLDEAMFNTIEKQGYGNDVHTICLLLRKA